MAQPFIFNHERLDSIVGKEGVAQTPTDHPTNISLVRWLSEQETQYRFIVYEAEPCWSEWTTRCLRQADRILIVGRAEADPVPGVIETEMRRLGPIGRQELVLLQPAGCKRPVDTHGWLARRKVAAHHHVRLQHSGDVGRLARRLTGRALGLVLGGGGARGYAHIGVIRALEEAGLQPDLVGGTSMGALVAGYYARGMDPDAMTEVSKQFGSQKQLFDYTLPLVSFMASTKLTNMLLALFEDLHIEDLWHPFFCMSSNLTRAKVVVHHEGLLWQAIRASLALPGVFSPVYLHDDLLVDGAVMNNLPIDVMREIIEGGIVIASSVTPEHDMAKPYTLDASISGWQVLWSRLNPFRQSLRVPSILEILARTLHLNDAYHRQQKRTLADLFISVPVGQFPQMDFRTVDVIAEAGYQAARQAIAVWQHH